MQQPEPQKSSFFYVSDERPFKPKGATYFIFGAWHKIGVHDYIYVHTGGRWTKSEKTRKEYDAAIIRQAREESLEERRKCQIY